jgi:2-iminobutanoate/2-iminopropanoate deaminase
VRLSIVPVLALLAGACSSPGSDTRRTDTSHDTGHDMRHLNAPGRADKLPFSHGIVAGDLYFVAGTLGLDPSGKPPTDPEAEARLMLDDFRAKLALADLAMEDLVAVTVYCPDLALYDAFNRVYASYFPSGRYPTRAFIGSGPLLRGCRFEIQGTAALR